MNEWREFAAALALMIGGIRLSAFYSGNETGFYRVSFLRLRLDAQAGDRIAQRLVWFTRNPSYFVATTLVGNNIANYLITLGLGWMTFLILRRETIWVEIATTLLAAPPIFVFGELVPKSVYYRIPLRQLRKDIGWFMLSYRVLYPLSLPLIGLTRLIRRFGGGERTAEMVLGRTGVQLLGQGHQAGLLTDVQSRLVHGLLHTAAESVSDTVTPANRILGLPETSTRREILDFARRYGLTAVPLRSQRAEEGWTGYVRVIDAAIPSDNSVRFIRPMPVIDGNKSRLEALLQLQEARAIYGAVYRNGIFLGLAHAHGLTEQLFRAPQTLGLVAAREGGPQ